MITIGTFARTADGGYRGAVRTLTLNLKGVEIRPVPRTADTAPDHRVLAGETEIGAAWSVARPGKPPGLSVRIDDPGLPAPLNALLVPAPDGEAHHLRWTRQRPTA
jgi:uncharacterized protein (DUF736 family)